MLWPAIDSTVKSVDPGMRVMLRARRSRLPTLSPPSVRNLEPVPAAAKCRLYSRSTVIAGPSTCAGRLTSALPFAGPQSRAGIPTRTRRIPGQVADAIGQWAGRCDDVTESAAPGRVQNAIDATDVPAARRTSGSNEAG